MNFQDICGEFNREAREKAFVEAKTAELFQTSMIDVLVTLVARRGADELLALFDAVSAGWHLSVSELSGMPELGAQVERQLNSLLDQKREFVLQIKEAEEKKAAQWPPSSL